ncbi:class I glutamine amidotransferase-like protein [Aspergillus sclerotioniger CBS 115572]|uniref:Class I glutamine amidotransferase-like protein n=1 Tax=Aspergillus sclerotioniger CBS 115572 TaxID=1450535 RepID=A0A317VVZ8_9EURO|nr:class I glutamine amidotransferase-like protein [Aspergillus sclerotioniger CBS 115572]PWY78514.1 class I glutamine amidotransferase-like protein [Aspergillus sclerotioniger CBS 115572]
MCTEYCILHMCWALLPRIPNPPSPSPANQHHTTDQPPSSINPQDHQPPSTLHLGVLLFPGFQSLDVFGPLDCLNILSWDPTTNPTLTLSLISTTLSPVPTRPPHLPTAISQSILPTHTLTTAPPLDVLLIPGGWGTRAPLPEYIEYIRTVYPALKYLLTVCTGARLAARAGVLDGKRATTNKLDWEGVVRQAPNVTWVREARWVVDGKVWSSAGVSAGIDLCLDWVEHIWGVEVAGKVERIVEFRRWREGGRDPFVVG